MARALATFTQDTAGRTNWGHPGLAKMLSGVDVHAATWKPFPGAHAIWEEVNHIAHWSRYVLRRLEGRGTPTRQAWPAGRGGDAGWRRAVADLARLHAAIARRVASLDDAALEARNGGRRYTMAQVILGCVAHISYHVGQIALLKKWYRHERRAAGKTL
ncbi:MAG: DinB family protein [Armatimonadota bacterium]|nr:DinB family protein [Armatimonadota bacterium]